MIKSWTLPQFYARIAKDFGLNQIPGDYSREAKPRVATYWQLGNGKVITVHVLDPGETHYTTFDYQAIEAAVLRQGGRRLK